MCLWNTEEFMVGSVSMRLPNEPGPHPSTAVLASGYEVFLLKRPNMTLITPEDLVPEVLWPVRMQCCEASVVLSC